MATYSILFIDDDEFILKIYRDRLTASGFVLDTAKTAAEGMQKIEANEYDLICTDNTLPDKPGKEIVIFSKQKKPNTPIVMFSASGQEVVMKEVLEAGADDYIVKDHVVPTELAQKLKDIIDKKRA